MNIKLVVVLCVTFVGFVWCQSGTDLPECIWHDPVKQADEWRLYHKQPCKITVFKPEEETVEDKRYEYGSAQFSFNVYVSDKIGPHRKIPETFHENCKKLNYDDVRLKASIVIIYHNEAYSVLVRMIDSIIERTPDHLLHEIILYDDASIPEHVIEEHIKDYANYANWSSKLKYFKSVERLGLIRAKTYASREATGDVLVFLDSHCEVNNRWIEPLLQVIQNNRTTVVLPVVDLIQPLNFEYSQAMVAKGGFDWALNFKWEYFDWSYFDIVENTVKPFNSAAMSGGLVAVDREYFKELGEYDENMEIWGGEQIEFSIRTWLCGGSVKIAPCSRVGHVFRMRRPYTGKPGVDTNAYNSLRTVKVWFDEKWQEKFFEQRPRTRKMDAGDLSARLELKNRLKCRDFDWYLDNVYPKLKPAKHEEL